MSVVDIHPEELLDREARGELLTAEERAMLSSHLDRCAACRLHRRARADFGQQIADGERAARLSGMVALALRAAAQPPPPQAAPAPPGQVGASSLSGTSRPLDVSSGNHPPLQILPPPAPRARAGRARMVVALSFAAVMVAGVAAAGFSGALRLGPPQAQVPEAPQASSPVVASPSPRKAARGLPTDKAEAPEADPASEPALPASSASPGASSPAPAPAPAAAEPPSSSPGPRVIPHGSTQPPRATAPAGGLGQAQAEPHAGQGGDAASLFSAASDARGGGEEREAARLYQELVRRHPQSREAQVARALLGRMALEHGDGARALEHFDGYLRSGDGALGEEAMVGRARTLERLGKGDEEAQAWAALLRAHPQSPHAAHARARLEALQKR